MESGRSWEVPPHVSHWFSELKSGLFGKVMPAPEQAAIFSADMIVGFCSKGNLASERVGMLAEPIAELFTRAHQHGVRNFVLLQDAHSQDAPEFDAYPPHAVRGSEESETIPELKALPFSKDFMVFPKNSLNPALNTKFDPWLNEHKQIQTAIVVGNCTDLCVYHLAMHLRMRANAFDLRDYRVIVPASKVDTYDAPEPASGDGIAVHPADFFHQVFLYHMALNGIEVLRDLV